DASPRVVHESLHESLRSSVHVSEIHPVSEMEIPARDGKGNEDGLEDDPYDVVIPKALDLTGKNLNSAIRRLMEELRVLREPQRLVSAASLAPPSASSKQRGAWVRPRVVEHEQRAY